MGYLDRSETECQPCDNFTECSSLYNRHQCPECGGIRAFCDNCYYDHHVGGWNSCIIPVGECRFKHPLCIARKN